MPLYALRSALLVTDILAKNQLKIQIFVRVPVLQ